MTAGPVAGREIWLAVMRRAGQRCECAGWCGRTHKDDSYRCGAMHTECRPLAAVPRDPACDVTAMLLPLSELWGLCDRCFQGVLARRRKAAREEAAEAAKTAPGLF